MSQTNPKPRPPLIAFPYPHFMAFAPLDVWIRMLFFPFVWCPPRYWIRLAWVLFTSAIGTVLTLPERLVLGPMLWAMAKRRSYKLHHKPGIVIVLGYFRTGTTHLHYLLSCDPKLRTPAWCETLAPHGFAASWGFLRLFLIPWIGSKRPQDDMDLGPSWPAEDDFAQNNGAAASSLAWRFVVPTQHKHYSRWHFLEGLSAAELSRWKRMQFAFTWKVSKLAGKRAILLKSPSHAARLGVLLDLYGPENVKCIHISRDANAVIESNVAMFRRMSVYGLQDRLPDQLVRGIITDEFVRTEHNYLRDAGKLPPGHICEVRYEDLVADPMGQLERAYRELGMEFTPEFHEHVVSYLHSVKEYRAANHKGSGGSGGAAGSGAAAKDSREVTPAPAEQIAELRSRFGHDRPAIAPVALPPNTRAPKTRERGGIVAAMLAAFIAAAVWLFATWHFQERLNFSVWLVGCLVGGAAITVAGAGTRRLGLIAATLTLIVQLSLPIPIALLSDYLQRDELWPHGKLLPISQWPWSHIVSQGRQGLIVGHNVFWGFMGAVTAFRFASRQYTRPPGTW